MNTAMTTADGEVEKSELERPASVPALPSPRPPRILGREDARNLRMALKAAKLPDRIAAMQRLAPRICEPEVWAQVSAHLDAIAEG